MGRTDHVREIAAPRGVDASRQPKDILLHLIQPRTGQHSADLSFFPKTQKVGHDAKMFAAPAFACQPHARLHFVKNQEHFVFITNGPQGLKPFLPEMIIATFPLDGFNDNGGDVGAFLRDVFSDLCFRNPLFFGHSLAALRFRQRKINERRAHAWPGKLGEVRGLFGVRVGQAQRVTAPAMERLFEVQDFRATLAAPGRQIFSHLPVHRGL